MVICSRAGTDERNEEKKQNIQCIEHIEKQTIITFLKWKLGFTNKMVLWGTFNFTSKDERCISGGINIQKMHERTFLKENNLDVKHFHGKQNLVADALPRC